MRVLSSWVLRVCVCVPVCVRLFAYVREASVRAYMRACLRACMPARLRACAPACLRASVPACLRACMRACARARARACVRAMHVPFFPAAPLQLQANAVKSGSKAGPSGSH